MIITDLGAAVTAAVAEAVAAGELPGVILARGLRTAGTWRPVPPDAGGGPGSYATSIPFLLAARMVPAKTPAPARVASVLAARLDVADLITQAAVTGEGYLSLTVSRDALGRLAVRITQAGPGCARSEALGGGAVTAPRDARLACAPSWPQAAQRLAAELTGRMSEAAGAGVAWTSGPPWPGSPPTTAGSPPTAAGSPPTTTGSPRTAAGPARTAAGLPPTAAGSPRGVPQSPPARPGSPHGASPVADAIAFAGQDAIRLALARHRPGARVSALTSPRAAAAHHLGNPAYAVRYAHAHAASAVRQAADLGFPKGDVERFQPRLLAHPRELVLLDAMSWLPERVAGAARRRQPHALTAYLEDLAGTYFDWQESCPLAQPGAFPPGPPGEPSGGAPGSPLFQARLWLADAARTTFGAGLGLLGVAAPQRC